MTSKRALGANYTSRFDDVAETHFGLGRVYFLLKKYAKANEEFDKALKIQSFDSLYLVWKGLALYYLIINCKDFSQKKKLGKELEQSLSRK